MRLFIIISLLIGAAKCATAQGDLLVYPKRVVFEGTKKSEQLNLTNIGKDSATYIISFVQYRMSENGAFEHITTPDPGQNFSDDNIRVFPRSVTLAPNESQTVKVQMVKTNLLSAGEYRSHIYFRAIAQPKALGEQEPVKDSGISIKIVPIFGVSIPTIIRVGENDAKVRLTTSSLSVEKDTMIYVNTVFNRTGNMSVYGDLTVEYVSPENNITKIGYAKGLAVYTPTPKRTFKLRIAAAAGVDFTRGKLVIRYSDQSPKQVELAKDEIDLDKAGLQNAHVKSLALVNNN